MISNREPLPSSRRVSRERNNSTGYTNTYLSIPFQRNLSKYQDHRRNDSSAFVDIVLTQRLDKGLIESKKVDLVGALHNSRCLLNSVLSGEIADDL